MAQARLAKQQSGITYICSQSSAGQLWWREISSNEMEHEKSDEIATNKVKGGSWRDKQLHLQQI